MSDPKPRELPEYVEWQRVNPTFTLTQYAYHALGGAEAVAFCQLLWPPLLMHHDGVFLAGSFSPNNFDKWMTELGNDVAAVERVMNHTHLGDLAESFQTLSTDNQRYLIEVIERCWRCRLREAYPERSFRVDIAADTEGVDHEITFYQAG